MSTIELYEQKKAKYEALLEQNPQDKARIQKRIDLIEATIQKLKSGE